MLIDQGRAIWLLVGMAIATVVVFVVQFVSGDLSFPMLTFFEAVKFLTAAFIGLLIQIVISSDEFRQEFQRFAISAYRRISDIRFSIHNIREDIAREQKRHSGDTVHGFDVIAARAEEIERQVVSSEDDWRDFLKREIQALEEIERRKDQIREIVASTSSKDRQSTDEQIRTLRKEIQHLADSLPLSLKTLIDIETGESLPREGRHSDIVADYLASIITTHGYLRIEVTSGELDAARIEEIRANAPYGYFVEGSVGSEYFNIGGRDGSNLGLVNSPLSSIYHKDFFHTLLEFLPAPGHDPGVGSGGPTYEEIPHSEFDGIAELRNDCFYIKVPI